MIIPTLVRGLCDDAAIFPPGDTPLAQALTDHDRHRASSHADLVGPLVLSAASVDEAISLRAGAPPLQVAVTVPRAEDVPSTVARLAQQTALPLGMVEAPVGVGTTSEIRSDLEHLLRVSQDRLCVVAAEINIRGSAAAPVMMAALDQVADEVGQYPVMAKFRTGGVTAELYPTTEELATAVTACVERGVPFKATAGLHHVLRNTDPTTGFDQHGFGNLLLATHAALSGADISALVEILNLRDADAVVAPLLQLTDDDTVRLRAHFRSFGTCSIADPMHELQQLGVLGSSDVDTRNTPNPGDWP